MNGDQITFFTVEGRRHGRQPMGRWLLEAVKALGITGSTMTAGVDGIGRNGRLHSAHFFELADQPVEVTVAVTELQWEALRERLEHEQANVFYVKTVFEYGVLGGHHSVFSKNRDRLIEHDAVTDLFNETVEMAHKRDLLSGEHFSVDGTLIQAWARPARPMARPSDVAAQMLTDVASPGKRVTVAAGKAYDTKGFVKARREMNVTPHVAQNTARSGGSAIDGRTTRHPGYVTQKAHRAVLRMGQGRRLDPPGDGAGTGQDRPAFDADDGRLQPLAVAHLGPTAPAVRVMNVGMAE
ncbi:uncharacterized protein DUF190 [Rubrivivax gelatinosus]|uniref:Uncharacterized protein DUF190 n=1 Tax=Rubrivivax gelatinosus TaxID=28068 RepID=A0A4R2MCQ2_RUBGE|nr:uncharacterized protein DUF190 [Rubrivivax gelatinosus]